MNHSDAFRDAIAAAGLTPPDEIIGDGAIHRFSSNGLPRDKAGWYVFHDDERPAGRFGCKRTDVDATWSSREKREFTPEEKAAWKKKMQDSAAQREATRLSDATDCAARAAEMWAEASTEIDHAYVTKKQVTPEGVRVLGGDLLIPLRHGPGAIVGLQRIQGSGEKRFLKGTPLAGAYTVLGKPSKLGPIVICEGWATGCSIRMATGYCVVVAFNAGNLSAVAVKIRKAMPEAEIIIGADDDAWTDGNPGASAAADAAMAVGGSVAAPRWYGDRAEKRTDFNDLHADEGLDAVRMCFEDPSQPLPRDDTRSVKPGSDGRPATIAASNNTGSVASGFVPLPEGDAIQEPGPVILPVPGSDVQILPMISDQFAPNCSDDELAARHLERMQSNTLWCEMWGRWMVWNGDRWLRDETNMVLDVVRQTCRMAANDVLSDPEIDNGKRLRQADKIASYRTIANVERLSRTYRSVASHPDDWDKDFWSLNTPGGVVNLRNGEMRGHSSSDRFTKMTNVTPSGSCPTWLEFLQRATGGDNELIGFLKRMCGYALTGEVREHALFFVYGTGGNGKGTFLNTITHIMGDYQRVSGSETFTESPGDRHTTELARLQGARLVTAQETEEGKRWAESRIKALTGGDPVTARFMRQDDFTYIPQFKLVIVGNHKPSFRSVDDAIRRRLHLVPFTAVIPSSEKDPMLPEKLKAEAAGILQWMIDGCLEWERDGLKPPRIVKESTEQYLGDEDSLQQWLDDCCDIGAGGFATSKALFFSWSKWCEQSGEFVGTMKRLMAKLESRSISTGQKFKGQRGCIGIKVKIDENNPF